MMDFMNEVYPNPFCRSCHTFIHFFSSILPSSNENDSNQYQYLIKCTKKHVLMICTILYIIIYIIYILIYVSILLCEYELCFRYLCVSDEKHLTIV